MDYTFRNRGYTENATALNHRDPMRFVRIIRAALAVLPWAVAVPDLTATEPTPGNSVSALPLVEVPLLAAAEGQPATSARLAVILTGDGGWAEIDQAIAAVLNRNGIPAVGFNSLKYFWRKRTAEETAGDVGKTLAHYLGTWKRERLLLIGYSRGADVLPFVVNRLPPELRARIDLVVLMGAAQKTAFEFHVADWFTDGGGTQYDVLPEALRLTGLRILCINGAEETDGLNLVLPKTLARVITLQGAHHFDGKYDDLAGLILEELKRRPVPAVRLPTP